MIGEMAVTAALIGLGGVIVGSLLTWFLGYFMEIHKLRIQREFHKFTTYHGKQLEVISHVYSLLAQVNRQFELFKLEWVIAKYFPFSEEKFKHVFPEKAERVELLNKTQVYVNEISRLYVDLKSFQDNNAIYLEKDLYRNIGESTTSIHHYILGYELFKQESRPIGGNDFAIMMRFFLSGEQNVQECLKYINSKFKDMMRD